MISGLPLHISVVFLLTAAFAVVMFYRSAGRSKSILLLSLIWLGLLAAIALTGFFQYQKGFPPRLALIVLPPLAGVIYLSFSRHMRRFDMRCLTFMQSFRIPAEMVLHWLFISSMVPEIMTYEGRNFDIIAGLTAPVVGFLYFFRKAVGRNTMLAWNIMGLLLLVNVVAISALSAPTDFQRFAHEMPNKAVFYFPFVWLPGFLAPLALLGHLVSIRQLLSMGSHSSQM